MKVKYTTINDDKAFLQYYQNQAGGEIPIFRGSSVQYGNGLGDVFRSIVKVAAPLARRVLPHVAKFGSKILSDISQGESIGSSIRKRGFESMDDVLNRKLPKLGRNLLKGSHNERDVYATVRKPQLSKSKRRKVQKYAY